MGKTKFVAVSAVWAITLSLCLGTAFANALAPKECRKADTRHQRSAEEHRQDIYREMNLTSQQKKLLDDNRQKHKESMRLVFDKMKSAREALNKELTASKIDTERISQIKDQMKEFSSQLLEDRVQSMMEVRNILTQEQFSKFLLLTERRMHPSKPGSAGGHWGADKMK